MIIIRVLGGLGNQLFQYAAAKALAHKRNTILKIDVSRFEKYPLRNFDLDKLSPSLSFASTQEIEKLKKHSTFEKLLSRVTPFSLRTVYKEPFFHYDPSFFKLGKNAFLQGYFQSEKYFRSITDELRHELKLDHLVSDRIKQEAGRIHHEDSVALHVRRGDYKDPETQKVHGVLPITYYREAIVLMKMRRPFLKFYLFSDDPEAVSEELDSPDVQIVSGQLTSSHFEDLYLMSQCRHNIIANSSFSWWGAWLNQNPEKIVIAPKNWFNEGPKDTQDLYPENWIKL